MLKTKLYDHHVQAGAKMVEFCGWLMPIQYTNIIKEHGFCRETAALFDISHMGRLMIKGSNALEFIELLFPAALAQLEINQAKYSFLLDENAHFIDDVIITKIHDNAYSLIVNAGNTTKVITQLKHYLNNVSDVELQDLTASSCQIAIQGKNAVAIIDSIATESVQDLKYYTGKEIQIGDVTCYISRLGYTGEDGFELVLAENDGQTIWERLQEAGKEYGLGLAGLAARDILRLEACMPLYGNDIDQTHNPIEAALSWAIDFGKKEYVFNEKLNEIKQQGVQQKLIALKMLDKGIPRKGYEIYDEQTNNQIGAITSGSHSPSLGHGIGLGYVNIELSKIGTIVHIKQRDKFLKAQIVKKPFINNVTR